MKTKLFYVAFLLLAAYKNTYCQESMGERVKNNARLKTENKANEKLDRAIDDILDGKIFKKKEKPTVDNNTEVRTEQNADTQGNGKSFEGAVVQTEPTFAAYSKFDFVPGDKVLLYDDFERVEMGDFPVEYNTNASGEVMTFSGKPGKWLALTKNGSFIPEQMGVLPDNFTLEMNVGILGDPSNNMSGLGFQFNTDKEQLMDYHFARGSFVTLHPAGGSASFSVFQPTSDNTMSNEFKMPQWDLYSNRGFARLSMWRQGGRLRVYINENKLMDIPRFFNQSKPYHLAFFRDFFNDCNLLVTDIKFAVGAPDTRNKLITEGKFSTTGILFDFQKANVKPESYGVIKEIAMALKEHAAVRVKIIGHTSNDGDANANLILSRQRAIAVKQVLSNEFGIDADRLETNGVGGSQPTDLSGTPEAKANNRRVEFVKL